jgi:ATP-binding cassette, subfamily B, bacterial PglK
MTQYLSRFLYVLSGSRKHLTFLIAAAMIASIFEALGIGMVGPFIAVVTNPNFAAQYPQVVQVLYRLHLVSSLEASTQTLIIPLSVLIILAFALKSFLSFYVQKYIFDFGYDQRRKLFSRLLFTYSKAPYTYHLNHNSAELIQKMVYETEQFATLALIPMLFVFSNSFIILAIVTLLLFTNVMALTIISGMLLVAFFLFQQFKHRISRWGAERSESSSAAIRIINHALGGIKEVRVIGCESYFANQADIEMRTYANAAASYTAFSNLPRYALEAFMATFLVIFTLAYLHFNPNSGSTITSVLAIFALAAVRMLPCIITVLGSVGNLRYASHSLNRMYLDLKELSKLPTYNPAGLSQPVGHQPMLRDSQNIGQVMPFQDQIRLDRISYQYPAASELSLKNVSLRLKKGQSIGIIGRSGAGKTTLVDLILGLLTPEDGDIKVDGASIYPDIRAWQNMIGYVPQSIFLIDDTLERNIAFGVPDHLIDYERLQRALEVSQLTDLVDRLPDGMATIIGERGTRLSGGQRQRVGIARVIYHDREILVLDEATSALDNETEMLVSEAVKTLGGTKTLIIIAHRLSTIEHCDCIYMMERGQVVKSGTYEEVVLGMPAAIAQSA